MSKKLVCSIAFSIGAILVFWVWWLGIACGIVGLVTGISTLKAGETRALLPVLLVMGVMLVFFFMTSFA